MLPLAILDRHNPEPRHCLCLQPMRGSSMSRRLSDIRKIRLSRREHYQASLGQSHQVRKVLFICVVLLPVAPHGVGGRAPM